MGKLKPRIIAVALPPYGIEFSAFHDRGEGTVRVTVSADHTLRVRLHRLKECKGRFCPIHHPSNHPLKDAPMILRLDREALLERVCEHGYGHSDPDSVSFLLKSGSLDDGTHGCDGCCYASEGGL